MKKSKIYEKSKAWDFEITIDGYWFQAERPVRLIHLDWSLGASHSLVVNSHKKMLKVLDTFVYTLIDCPKITVKRRKAAVVSEPGTAWIPKPTEYFITPTRLLYEHNK